MSSSTPELKTAPVDYRFSTSVDKMKQCWSNYNEYLRCGKKLGVEHKKCQQSLAFAKQICTNELLNHYYEARRDDLWYGYQLPLQPSELKDDDVPKTPADEDHHAHAWNAKHPTHKFGAKH